MIWGAMPFMRTAGLYFLPPETTINGEKYVDLFTSKLELCMRVHNCEIFMQDGVPCHRSKMVKKFLKRKRIQMFEWPGNSPDLNPIENLWHLMKNKVSEKHLSSLAAVRTAIKEVWVREISANYCCKLINSMPRRRQEVIKSKGGHTKCPSQTYFCYFCVDLLCFYYAKQLINHQKKIV